jgi:phage terminase large subunit-like protein
MRGRMAMLGLYVRQGAPWFADLRAELLSFPAGKHDDQVDASALSFPKIPSARIRALRQNQSIILGDACMPSAA